MRVDGFEGVGAMSPCEQYGMLLCRFSPVTNKIISTEMVFDVMGFMQELQVSLCHQLSCTLRILLCCMFSIRPLLLPRLV